MVAEVLAAAENISHHSPDNASDAPVNRGADGIIGSASVQRVQDSSPNDQVPVLRLSSLHTHLELAGTSDAASAIGMVQALHATPEPAAWSPAEHVEGHTSNTKSTVNASQEDCRCR